MINSNKEIWSKLIEWNLNNFSKYDEAYFEKGDGSGYLNYSWKPEFITPFINAILNKCKIKENGRVLDFGCAKGFYVKLLFELGYNSLGTDISEYAISKAPKDVKERLYLLKDYNLYSFSPNYFDLTIAKDVLEHLPEFALLHVIQILKIISQKIFVIVPICIENGSKYINFGDEKDTTHIIRYTKETWQNILGGTECSDLCSLIKRDKSKGSFCCYIDSSVIIDKT